MHQLCLCHRKNMQTVTCCWEKNWSWLSRVNQKSPKRLKLLKFRCWCPQSSGFYISMSWLAAAQVKRAWSRLRTLKLNWSLLLITWIKKMPSGGTSHSCCQARRWVCCAAGELTLWTAKGIMKEDLKILQGTLKSTAWRLGHSCVFHQEPKHTSKVVKEQINQAQRPDLNPTENLRTVLKKKKTTCHEFHQWAWQVKMAREHSAKYRYSCVFISDPADLVVPSEQPLTL